MQSTEKIVAWMPPARRFTTVQPKLDRIDSLLDSGFSLDEITSDGSLDIHLSRGPTSVTIRFAPDEVAELWPHLFDGATVRPAASGNVLDLGSAGTVLQPERYGLREVVGFLERDHLDRIGWLEAHR